jgi:hypothetical protein
MGGKCQALITVAGVAIHPIPRLLLSPTGNGVALEASSNRLSRACVACARFGVAHPCGVG